MYACYVKHGENIHTRNGIFSIPTVLNTDLTFPLRVVCSSQPNVFRLPDSLYQLQNVWLRIVGSFSFAGGSVSNKKPRSWRGLVIVIVCF